MALDQSTGEELWAMNLGSSVTGYPASFAINGQQYVATSTGRWLSDAFTPELTHGTQNTLFVFALPETGIGFLPDVGATWLLARAPGELQFAHAVFRETLYDELAAERRQHLHTRAGVLLEEVCRETGSPHLSVLSPVHALLQSYLGAHSSARPGAQHMHHRRFKLGIPFFGRR